jgi:hypothetical protein
MTAFMIIHDGPTHPTRLDPVGRWAAFSPEELFELRTQLAFAAEDLERSLTSGELSGECMVNTATALVATRALLREIEQALAAA